MNYLIILAIASALFYIRGVAAYENEINDYEILDGSWRISS